MEKKMRPGVLSLGVSLEGEGGVSTILLLSMCVCVCV